MDLTAAQQSSEPSAPTSNLTQTRTNTAGDQAEPPIPSAEAREREEVRALIICFSTGISIAFLFLIYILLEYAKLLT